MATAYVLYNNKAGDGNALESAKTLEIIINDEMKYIDVTEVSDYRIFITGLVCLLNIKTSSLIKHISL